jgi:hypothetical protein
MVLQLRLAGLVVLTGVALAQGRPDLSGRWTLIPERSVFQGRDGPVTFFALGSDFTIKITDSDTLVLTLAGELPRQWTVKLNGEPTLHAASGSDERLVRTTVTATWDDNRLIVRMDNTEIRQGKEIQYTQRYRFSVNPDHTLTVESPLGLNWVTVQASAGHRSRHRLAPDTGHRIVGWQ